MSSTWVPFIVVDSPNRILIVFNCRPLARTISSSHVRDIFLTTLPCKWNPWKFFEGIINIKNKNHHQKCELFFVKNVQGAWGLSQVICFGIELCRLFGMCLSLVDLPQSVSLVPWPLTLATVRFLHALVICLVGTVALSWLSSCQQNDIAERKNRDLPNAAKLESKF